MRIPGFTAESTVYRSTVHYRVDRYGFVARGTVVAQGRGAGLQSICSLECRGVCWNICAGHPGSTACKRCRTECVKDCESPVFP
ncbi:hypothetical protein [Kitasatospora sp. NPDC057223]|uniref:hypothetical protein n=1 Tax=Kitasatospora sp. NPDC057223 TaxID=3346055 RepID=UPI003643F55A